MRLNVAMLRRIARRIAAGRGATLESLAISSKTVWPEKETAVPPAVYPVGALDRVTGLSPWRSWAVERPLIEGGRVRLGATRALLFENADLAGPCLYAGGVKQLSGYGPERLLLRGAEYRVLDRANLVTTYSGSHFFGAYLYDDYPIELVFEGDENIGLQTRPFEHDAGYRHAVGLAMPQQVAYGHVRRLNFITDAANNEHKAGRYRTLRSRLRTRVPARDGAPPRGVYLKRGRTGEPRLLANEPEIERILSDAGVVTVEPSALPTEAIIRETLGVKLVVGIEGSQLSHAIFTMADDAAFLALQPPDRFALNYKEFTDCMGMGFAFLVGTRVGEGFRIDPHELRQMLGRLL